MMKFPKKDQGQGAGARWGMFLLTLASVAGCSNDGGRSAMVSGKVTLANAPVTAGTVLFINEGGHAASAELQPDGTYTLHCRPDRYQVAVTPPPPADPLASSGAAVTPQADIPAQYQDFARSGLSTEVKPGNNTFDIPLAK